MDDRICVHGPSGWRRHRPAMKGPGLFPLSSGWPPGVAPRRTRTPDWGAREVFRFSTAAGRVADIARI